MKTLKPKHQKTIRLEFGNIDRKELAEGLKTSMSYIHQLVGGFILASPKRARDIERLTKGKVRAAVLRPDIFGNNGNE